MIELHDKESGALLGEIEERHLQFLIDQLEEESADDDDYYINQSTLDSFEEEGADAALMAILRKALGQNEDMEIRWTRK